MIDCLFVKRFVWNLTHSPVDDLCRFFFVSKQWPSFRDEEVEWRNVRVLPGGETVSVDGTHLGESIDCYCFLHVGSI